MGLSAGSTPDSLDPATSDDVMDVHIDYAIRNKLVEIDCRGKSILELAESWGA